MSAGETEVLHRRTTRPTSRVAAALASAATLPTAVAVGAAAAPPIAEVPPPVLDVDRLAAAMVLVSAARFDPLK